MAAFATYSAFGLAIRSAFELPWEPHAEELSGRRVELTLVERDEAAAWSGTTGPRTWDTVFPGGRRVTVERGVDGAQLIRYADQATFVLSPAADRIQCAAVEPEDPSWQRFLLDTVLWWTALANGVQILHASAVEVDGRVVVIVSPSGGGKSTLAGVLLRRGAQLFTDDVLAVTTEDGVLAHPGPPLMNLASEREDLAQLGTELARLHEGDDERWVLVDRASRAARPPALLLLYRRGPGLELAAVPASAGVLDLMPFAWGIPDDLEGARRRFLAMGDVASATPAYHLTAGASSTPAAVADLVEEIALHWTNVRGAPEDGGPRGV
jgi:hypothetical protein